MKPLSATDSAFLWMETRNQPMHVAGLNLYTPPRGAGADYISNLMADWGQHLAALSPFNQRPVLRLGRWHWEEDKEFELDYHLRHVALPKPGRIRELLAMVSHLHGNLMDRNRPLWEMVVIEGLPEGRFATYTKIHHALVDGVTGARMLAQSLAGTAKELKPPFWAQDLTKPTRSGAATHPAAGSRAKAVPQGLLAQLSLAARAGQEILPGIGSGLRDLLFGGSTNEMQGAQGGGQSAMAMPFQAPPTPFNVQISGSRRFASQSYSLARLKLIGDATGATVNDVTLAICAGALRKYLQVQGKLPKKPLVAMVPVSLHSETDAGGNQVSLLLANLATHLADPLARLKHIVQSTTEAKDRLKAMPRLQKMAHGMTSISPMGAGMITGGAKQRPAFNVVISNVPGPKNTLYLNGARLDEVYPVSIAAHYLALNITINGYGDNLGFGYIACRRSVPHLQRMLDYTDDAIDELEQALVQSTATETPKGPKVRKPAVKRATAPKAKSK